VILFNPDFIPDEDFHELNKW